jgi:hypothetical protein
MEICEGVEVELHMFLNSELDWCHLKASIALPPGKEPLPSTIWMGPSAGLNSVDKENISCFYW